MSEMGGAPSAPVSGSNGGGNSSSSTASPSSGSNIGSDSSHVKGGSSNIPLSSPGSQSSSSQTSSPEIFEVKVNGKTLKMSRDEVIAHAQMSHAAQARFEEAARTRKSVDKIISTAKNNPIQALMDPELGLTKDQIRDAFEKWYTQEYIEPESLTPEQRKSKEMERELEKYRTSEKEMREKMEREQQEKLTATQREYLQNQIIEAMDKSGLPRTKFFAQRMAFYMRENLRQGWDAPLDLIVSQVKKEHQERNAEISKDATVEQLVEMFGEDVINKIRRHDLEQLRKRRQFPQTSSQSVDGYGNTEKTSMSEVNKRLREIRMGKR
jgi:hypothetical protein